MPLKRAHWEYETVILYGSEDNRLLTKYGELGWRVVGVVPNTSGLSYTVILERMVEDSD